MLEVSDVHLLYNNIGYKNLKLLTFFVCFQYILYLKHHIETFASF